MASGAADDWALGVAKIPYTYTVELRDKGRYSFFLPPDQIQPSGEEMMAGLAASAMEIVKIYNEGLVKVVRIKRDQRQKRSSYWYRAKYGREINVEDCQNYTFVQN